METWTRPAELARWSPAWREHWGKKANDLEAAGVPWPESERRAFAEVVAERAERARTPVVRPEPAQPTPKKAPRKQGALNLGSR